MHHRREIGEDGSRHSKQKLIEQGLYYGRPAFELIFLRHAEHSKLHNTGKFVSDTTRQKISLAKKGNHPSEESCQKMSKSKTGCHWWNDRISSKLAKECPGTEWIRGRLKNISEVNIGKHWWNNGIQNIRSRECPGEGWKRGRFKQSCQAIARNVTR